MALPFIEIIEAITPDPNLLMWKFADADKEIKNGAVSNSQGKPVCIIPQ